MKNYLWFSFSLSGNINHSDCSGMTCFSTVLSDSLAIRLNCFVDLAYAINGHAFSEYENVSLVVSNECFGYDVMKTAH